MPRRAQLYPLGIHTHTGTRSQLVDDLILHDARLTKWYRVQQLPDNHSISMFDLGERSLQVFFIGYYTFRKWQTTMPHPADTTPFPTTHPRHPASTTIPCPRFSRMQLHLTAIA